MILENHEIKKESKGACFQEKGSFSSSFRGCLGVIFHTSFPPMCSPKKICSMG